MREKTQDSFLVLILILLEVTQIKSKIFNLLFYRLNPYSTGSNSNMNQVYPCTATTCLNPYSTGSNSNTLIINNLFFTLCFVYFS